MSEFNNLSNTELRLALASTQSTKVKSWRGSFLKQDRIAAITQELLDRGAF